MMLFDARGDLLPQESYFNNSQIECIEQTDDMIDYYFYFFEAMHESYNKNFEGTISLYKAAEKNWRRFLIKSKRLSFISKCPGCTCLSGKMRQRHDEYLQNT
ncbi:hypothetical protein P9D51_17240 [Bacillus sonorensis]|uniref:hypothetical protein n=1 Tax=Bacillus sonorensis TaxID=119858 RepID=UPI002DB6EA51|nr:hypothetical protein [Bacillus sonorensis]MEC1356516.1 hypothetical protein [Bacillus sonorensis]MEC1427800.1 hypothetical protein [Bacillus sonorensis]MEC1439210.1 hypothetical protein [Bacillus sonorensis]